MIISKHDGKMSFGNVEKHNTRTIIVLIFTLKEVKCLINAVFSATVYVSFLTIESIQAH